MSASTPSTAGDQPPVDLRPQWRRTQRGSGSSPSATAAAPAPVAPVSSPTTAISADADAAPVTAGPAADGAQVSADGAAVRDTIAMPADASAGTQPGAAAPGTDAGSATDAPAITASNAARAGRPRAAPSRPARPGAAAVGAPDRVRDARAQPRASAAAPPPPALPDWVWQSGAAALFADAADPSGVLAAAPPDGVAVWRAPSVLVFRGVEALAATLERLDARCLARGVRVCTGPAFLPAGSALREHLLALRISLPQSFPAGQDGGEPLVQLARALAAQFAAPLLGLARGTGALARFAWIQLYWQPGISQVPASHELDGGCSWEFALSADGRRPLLPAGLTLQTIIITGSGLWTQRAAEFGAWIRRAWPADGAFAPSVRVDRRWATGVRLVLSVLATTDAQLQASLAWLRSLSPLGASLTIALEQPADAEAVSTSPSGAARHSRAVGAHAAAPAAPPSATRSKRRARPSGGRAVSTAAGSPTKIPAASAADAAHPAVSASVSAAAPQPAARDPAAAAAGTRKQRRS